MISPFAKLNYVDHSLNDITSIIGDPQSFDVLAGGSIMSLFDFHQDDFNPASRTLLLNPSTGQPVP